MAARRDAHPCCCSWFLMSLLSLFLKIPNSRIRPRRRQLLTSWKSGNRLYTMNTRTLRASAPQPHGYVTIGTADDPA